MFNQTVETLKFLNMLGLWEIVNVIILIIGVIFGSIFFIRGGRIPMLNIFTNHGHRPGTNYTSLINIEFRNYVGCSLVICNPYFKYRDLHPDPAAHRDSYSGETEVKFCGQGTNALTEIETFIQHKNSTATWIPIDPKHTDEEVKTALEHKRVGVLYYTCIWIKEKPRIKKISVKI